MKSDCTDRPTDGRLRTLSRLGMHVLPPNWNLTTVGEACSINNDLRLPLSTETRAAMSGHYPYYGPTGVLSFIDEYRVEGTFALIGEDGDHFLDFEDKAQTLRVSGKFNVNNHAHIVGDGTECTVDWFCCFFQHRDIRHSITRQGASRYKLTKAALEQLPIVCPPMEEQRKLATILRTWDEAIDRLNSLVTAKQTEYASYSRRFFAPCHPSFQGRGDGWNALTLGNLFAERTESGLDSDELLSITMADGVISQNQVGRRDSSTEDKSKYKLILPGDIGYNTMRMWQGVCGLSKQRGIVSPAYTVVTPIEARINGRYAFHLFKSKRMIHDFERYSQGLTSDTWNLKFPAFSEIRVYFPEIPVQVAQANYLDAMQQQMDVLERQADALSRQKRGLMQKLLTGKWRVKADGGAL